MVAYILFVQILAAKRDSVEEVQSTTAYTVQARKLVLNYDRTQGRHGVLARQSTEQSRRFLASVPTAVVGVQSSTTAHEYPTIPALAPASCPACPRYEMWFLAIVSTDFDIHTGLLSRLNTLSGFANNNVYFLIALRYPLDTSAT